MSLICDTGAQVHAIWRISHCMRRYSFIFLLCSYILAYIRKRNLGYHGNNHCQQAMH